MSEVAFLAIKIRVGFENLAPERLSDYRAGTARAPFEVFFGLLEFAAVKMQPCDVKMADRFLRQLLVGLALAKNASEPAQSLAKISAKPGASARLCVIRRTYCSFPQFFGEFERDTGTAVRPRSISLARSGTGRACSRTS